MLQVRAQAVPWGEALRVAAGRLLAHPGEDGAASAWEGSWLPPSLACKTRGLPRWC